MSESPFDSSASFSKRKVTPTETVCSPPAPSPRPKLTFLPPAGTLQFWTDLQMPAVSALVQKFQAKASEVQAEKPEEVERSVRRESKNRRDLSSMAASALARVANETARVESRRQSLVLAYQQKVAQESENDEERVESFFL